jgi:hypothetical protein
MHPNLAIISQNCCGASPKNGISLEGIIIFLEKISAKTPNPDLLRRTRVSLGMPLAVAAPDPLKELNNSQKSLYTVLHIYLILLHV